MHPPSPVDSVSDSENALERGVVHIIQDVRNLRLDEYRLLGYTGTSPRTETSTRPGNPVNETHTPEPWTQPRAEMINAAASHSRFFDLNLQYPEGEHRARIVTFEEDGQRTPSPRDSISMGADLDIDAHLRSPGQDTQPQALSSQSRASASHAHSRWKQRQRLHNSPISPRHRARGHASPANSTSSPRPVSNNPVGNAFASPSGSRRSSFLLPRQRPETAHGYPLYINLLSAHLVELNDNPYPLWYQILTFWFPQHEGYEIQNEWQPPAYDGLKPNIFKPERCASIAVLWKRNPVVLLQICEAGQYRTVASSSVAGLRGRGSQPGGTASPASHSVRDGGLALQAEDKKAMRRAGEQLFDDAALYSGLPALCVILAVGRRWSGFVRGTDLQSGTRAREELGEWGWVGNWRKGKEVTEDAVFEIMGRWFMDLRKSCVGIDD